MIYNEKSKILIVEDHLIFRMGLRELINQENDLTVCGQTESVQEASVSVAKAIRRILKGYLYVSEKVSSRLMETVVKHPDAMAESPLDHLTDRELEIFQMIGRGLYTGEIADRLHLSTKTVGTYRERIKAKLGFTHGMDLVRYAVIWVEQGIIPSKIH